MALGEIPAGAVSTIEGHGAPASFRQCSTTLPTAPAAEQCRSFLRTPFQVRCWRGGRFAWAWLEAACIPERSCAGRTFGCTIISCCTGSHQRHAGTPEKRGTEVPKHHSIHIPAASAATASGSLETAIENATSCDKPSLLRGAFPIEF